MQVLPQSILETSAQFHVVILLRSRLESAQLLGLFVQFFVQRGQLTAELSSAKSLVSILLVLLSISIIFGCFGCLDWGAIQVELNDAVVFGAGSDASVQGVDGVGKNQFAVLVLRLSVEKFGGIDGNGLRMGVGMRRDALSASHFTKALTGARFGIRSGFFKVIVAMGDFLVGRVQEDSFATVLAASSFQTVVLGQSLLVTTIQFIALANSQRNLLDNWGRSWNRNSLLLLLFLLLLFLLFHSKSLNNENAQKQQTKNSSHVFVKVTAQVNNVSPD